MTILTNLLSKLKRMFLFLLPIAYMAYIIYIRLILERPLRLLDVPLSKLQIFFTVFIILALIMRIYFLLKKLEVIPEKEKKSAMVRWLLEKVHWLSEHYSQLWIDFHRFFVAKNVKIHMLVKHFGAFLGKHKTPRFMLTVIIIFQVLPKTIVVTTFLFELLVYNHFFYFYKVISLLLLPLIYTALRAMLSQFYEDNAEFFNGFITITEIPSEENSDFFTFRFAFKEGYTPPSFVKSLDDFLINHMYPIVGIDKTIRLYDACMVYYKIYWIFLINLYLYLFGWSLILFCGI